MTSKSDNERQRYLRRKNDPTWKEKRRKIKRNQRAKHYFTYTACRLRHKYKINVTAWDLWKILKSQRLRCPLTNRILTRKTISIDHKIPLSKGGTEQISNLRFVNYHANLAKASFTESELLQLAIDLVKTMA